MLNIYHFSIFFGMLPTERDTSGIYGGIFHYSLILAFMGSALLSFLYFWSKGQLDMDETPKIQMMHDEMINDEMMHDEMIMEDENGSEHDIR